MLNAAEIKKIENLVTEDFDQMDFADKPMETFCAYNRDKHIAMATQLVVNAFNHRPYFVTTEVTDMIHGLNHLFFNGVAAGQSFTHQKEK